MKLNITSDDIETTQEGKKMTINYKGISKDYEYRVAEISYNEDDKKDTELAERVAFFLKRIKGWDIDTSVSGWMVCEVENMDEYKEFKKDYKESKKMILSCMKYGF